MPIFAPVYRPTKQQQTFLARKQKRESRKRKRGGDSSGDESNNDHHEQSTSHDDATRQASSAIHPVRKTDPYHVAGHPREEPLPPPPFPHAAVEESREPKLPIDEELAQLNPPIYVTTAKQDDKSSSLKRRHLDNLTAILHKSMLNGDWSRASRAWAILIRVEIAGRGIDVRRSGRWGIGAELLMRRDAQKHPSQNQPFSEVDGLKFSETTQTAVDESSFAAEGFKLAREYYERLILQYPYTFRTQHDLNAMAIYPALFNVWIYEVQDRSKQTLKKIDAGDTSMHDNSSDTSSSLMSSSEQSAARRKVKGEELDQANAIAQRMDEVLMSPPYDTNPVLLQLKSMVSLWLSDLYSEQLSSRPTNDGASEDDSINVASIGEIREKERLEVAVLDEKRKAKDVFRRLVASGAELPKEITMLLSEEGDA